MNKKTNLLGYILLLFFFSLGILLRIFKLSEIPQGFNWDEAANGYNAYSLLKTGADEFGQPWPIMMKSFGEYKTGIGSIILVPVIKVLGLSVFSVRLPTALFGGGLILAGFFLALQIFKQIIPASLVAGLIAISPWAIHTSRFSLEWYLGLPLMVFGIGLLISKIKWRFSLAAIILTFSLYFYYSIKFFIPLFLVFYAVIYRQSLKKQIKTLTVSFFIGLLCLLPLINSLRQVEWLNREKKVATFVNEDKISELNEGIYRQVVIGLPLIRLFNNKLVFFGKEFTDKYLQHFSPEFLLLGQDASSLLEITKVGKIYLISLPFIILGLIEIIKKRHKTDLVLLTWLLLAPIPSSLTVDSPHGLRAIILLPVLEILTVKGFLAGFIFIKKNNFIKFVSIVSVIIIYSISLLYFLWQYYLFYPEYTAEFWLDGYKEAVEKTNNYKQNYDRVVFTTNKGQPHIFLAFFTPIDPATYQHEVINQQNIFNAFIPYLNGVEFRMIRGEDYCLKNTLIIDLPQNNDLVERLDIVYIKNRFHPQRKAFELFDTNNPTVQKYLCPNKLKSAGN